MPRGAQDEGGPRPAVYARLRAQAEQRTPHHRPARWVKWVGWGIIAAIAAMVLNIAVNVQPWG